MRPCEPIAALRVITAELETNLGAPLPPNHTFATGDLKLIKPDGTIANASSLPTPTPNSVIPGSFDIAYTEAETNEVGRYKWQLTGAAYSNWEYVDYVEPLDCLYYGVIVTVPSGVAITLDPSNPGGNASAAVGFYASLGAGRVCLARPVTGAAVGQCRLGIDYGTGHQLTLDSPWVTPPSPGDVIRLEQVIDTPLLSTDQRIQWIYNTLQASVQRRYSREEW